MYEIKEHNIGAFHHMLDIIDEDYVNVEIQKYTAMIRNCLAEGTEVSEEDYQYIVTTTKNAEHTDAFEMWDIILVTVDLLRDPSEINKKWFNMAIQFHYIMKLA
jgi:hypothetical protein